MKLALFTVDLMHVTNGTYISPVDDVTMCTRGNNARLLTSSPRNFHDEALPHLALSVFILRA